MSKLKNYLERLSLAGESEIPTRSFISEQSCSDSPQRMPDMNCARNLDDLSASLQNCSLCKLYLGRSHLVFGSGNPKAKLMFVGEGPGREEDEQGLPFVGRSGKLLTKIIEAMGLNREDVYIANVVKCRPPENRNPELDEIKSCSPFLHQQIEFIRPEIIVTLGTFASQNLLNSELSIGRLRGDFHKFPNRSYIEKYQSKLKESSTLLLATYHPAFLLRNPKMKKDVWEDMQKVMKHLGLKIQKVS